MTRSTALLFEPAFLGPLHARNRIVMPAMHLGMSPDGDPGADEVAFYRRRARAGTGTIIVGMCNTEPRAQNDLKGVLDLSDDAHIGPMSLLAAAIRDEGALAGAQLSPACGYNNPAWHPPEADMLPLLDRIGQAAARAAARFPVTCRTIANTSRTVITP